MKSAKITYWITTSLIVAFEGLLPALTFNSPLAKAGVSHLGYPDYFRVAFTLFKVLGAIALIFPQIPRRVKEWAYAGLLFDLIGATYSIIAIGGNAAQWGFMIVPILLGALSYFYYHKRSHASILNLKPAIS